MKSIIPGCPTIEPFGLYFRQVISIQPYMAQTTQEPEITTGDGKDPDKIDSVWIPDEDEDKAEPPPKK
jgi:hypothetical protein